MVSLILLTLQKHSPLTTFRLKTYTLPYLSKIYFRLREIVQFQNKSFAKPDFPGQKGA